MNTHAGNGERGREAETADWIQQARNRTYNCIARLSLLPDAERDTVVALKRVELENLAFFVLAARDAGLPRELAPSRLAAVWALMGAVNLMDDLADGDCDYLPAPVAPNIVVLLQSLASVLAIDAGVSASGLARASQSLLRMAAGQAVEVRTKAWDAETYKAIADEIGGDQYGAYLGLLWDGTALASSGAELARLIGRAGMVAKDLRSRDPRVLSIPSQARSEVTTWAIGALTTLEAGNLQCARLLSRFARPVLSRYAERPVTTSS